MSYNIMAISVLRAVFLCNTLRRLEMLIKIVVKEGLLLNKRLNTTDRLELIE